VKFITGIQYRHLLVIKGGSKYIDCAPPHDHPNEPWRPLLVKPASPSVVSTSPADTPRLSPQQTADLLNKLILVIEYDIYDKRGNKIAERTATNALAYPLAELERGEERTLQINIDPSYLYDLSLNDPPIVVVRN
jgi:2,3-bisphosphoglycerate-independent phosphoglycerate mutase